MITPFVAAAPAAADDGNNITTFPPAKDRTAVCNDIHVVYSMLGATWFRRSTSSVKSLSDTCTWQSERCVTVLRDSISRIQIDRQTDCRRTLLAAMHLRPRSACRHTPTTHKTHVPDRAFAGQFPTATCKMHTLAT